MKPTAGIAVIALALLGAPRAASADIIGKAYEDSKPTPGGITPQTRGETLRCMHAWTVVGNLVSSKPQAWAARHPDFNPDTAAQLIQHWGKKAKSGYGSDRIDAYNRDLDALLNRPNPGTEEMLSDLSMAGSCYVAAGQRSIVDSDWTLVQSIVYSIKVPPAS